MNQFPKIESFIIIATIIGVITFYYALSKRLPYTNEKTINPSRLGNYSLLTACLLFVFVEIFIEFQYNIFGGNYGLAVFIPSILFLFTSYFFDNLGVLSLALMGLTSWVGVAINPMDLLNPVSNDTSVTNASIAFGIALVVVAEILDKKNIKKHFTFTHFNFAAMMLLIYCISGIMQDGYRLIYFFLLLASTVFFVVYAKKEKSAYFLIVSVVSLYIGFTYLVFHYLQVKSLVINLFVLIYFFVSLVLFILFLFKYKAFLGKGK